MALELLLHLPGVRVPNDRALVHRPGEQQARGRSAQTTRLLLRPLEGEDRPRVPRERAHERAVARRPQARDAVVRARGEQAAARGPVERGDVAGLVPRGGSCCCGCSCRRGPFGCVPQDERRRDNRRAATVASSSTATSSSPAAPNAPEPRGPVPGARRQRPAVGRPRQSEDLGAVPLEPRHGGLGDRWAVVAARPRSRRRRSRPGPAAGPAAALSPVRHGALELLHVLGDQVARRQRRKVPADSRAAAAAAARVFRDVGLELQVLKPLLHERDEGSWWDPAAGLSTAVDEGLVAEDEGGVGETFVVLLGVRREKRAEREREQVSFFLFCFGGNGGDRRRRQRRRRRRQTSNLSRGRIRPCLSSSLTHRGSFREKAYGSIIQCTRNDMKRHHEAPKKVRQGMPPPEQRGKRASGERRRRRPQSSF